MPSKIVRFFNRIIGVSLLSLMVSLSFKVYSTSQTIATNKTILLSFQQQLTLDVSYLMWWLQPGPTLIPVATEAPITAPFSNVLGGPDTTIVLGNKPLTTPVHNGGRFNLDYWFSDEHTIGLDAGYFFLSERTKSQAVSSQETFLGSPFFNVTTGTQDVTDATIPGIRNGSIATSNYSKLQGAEFNLVKNLSYSDKNITLLAGFYYLEIDEGLSINTTRNLVLLNGSFATFDKFLTKNNFFSGQIGTKINYPYGPFLLEGSAKLALGYIQKMVSIQGEQISSFAPTQLGGIYALPTNIGKQRHNNFALAPEITIGTGYPLNQLITAYINYNFVYLNTMVRPANQVNSNLNFSQLYGPLVGPPAPLPLFNSTSFWAQGIQLGLRYSGS